ncbi:MAG: PTS ascorbate transporter subunit IIC [Bacillota bacterium]
MTALSAIANFLKDYVFNQPAFFIGLVALLGLLLQKKSFSDTVSGTIKTVVGVLIITTAAGQIAGLLLSLAPIIQHAFGLQSFNFSAIGTDKFIQQYGSPITLIMTFGFLVNLLLARFTRFKYIYLTGHLMFWMALVWVAVLVETFGTDLSQTAIIASGAVVMGLYWTFQPALTQPYMRKITGNNELALGHTTGVAAFLAGWAGKFVGDPKDSTENMRISEGFRFFQDITVATSLVMAIVYIVANLFAGPQFVATYAKGQNYVYWGLLQGIQFGAFVTVLLLGVRLMIAEIVPAFRGIAMKVVPNAIPALDAPIVFTFAPTAVIVGFLSTFVTVIILTFIFGLSGIGVLIPPMIPIFFPGATAGVFGNATGGRRGAILAGVITGLLIGLGEVAMVRVMATTVPDVFAWATDPDWAVFAGFWRAVLSLFR